MSNKYVVSGLGENCSAPVLAHLPNYLGFHLLRTTHASPRTGAEVKRVVLTTPYYLLTSPLTFLYCALLTTHASPGVLMSRDCRPAGCGLLFTMVAYYLPLLTTCYLLLTTYYRLLATYNLQPTPCYSLLTRSGSHASRPLAPGCGGAVPLSTRGSPPLSSAART